MYENVLVPYDFGNSFKNVPEQLKKLTQGAATYQIVIFNVISETELANYVRYQGKHFEDVVEEKKEEMRPFLNTLDDQGLKYQIKFTTGSPTHEIVNEIEGYAYDIVVMSNKRAEMDIKHVLGHVTHKIAKRVNVPVLIVK
ncbi:universal stress protein [Staphylococcus hyicus]|uniref:universal stress protein n=1 Tax=Staphylococcus hyicus TaxID=1284 RepID=UPI00057E3582|nr:universal stress protein [Staphylococcus hyicus]AJC95199.1 universal stress protein [Staphylococcus hyicus]MCE5153754.1 universal stress protein [Staphylococcus hyicus]MCQ9300082.1 universal stress protein [Staphylococcus hyicus]RTX69742.1 universal stress protein [Staphylococcus hyicus]SQE46695.1 universal stress protein family [Staphylococcus hyicus]